MSREEANCRLVVGIGNPGSEYAGTRHNAGFETIDRFLRKHPNFTKRRARNGEAWEGRVGGRTVLLLKPSTYVNLSGDAVLPLMQGEKILPNEILIVYDDMDMPVGKMRIRCGGGSAGHNGMKSIIEALQSENFPRLRIGIGNSEAKRRRDFVLSSFDGEEKETFERTLNGAVEAIELLLHCGSAMAMNQYNSRDYSPVRETEKEEKTTEQHQQEVGLEKV